VVPSGPNIYVIDGPIQWHPEYEREGETPPPVFRHAWHGSSTQRGSKLVIAWFKQLRGFPPTPSLPGRGILWAVNQHQDGRIEDGSNLMRQSVADSDRKFWTGQKPLSLIQWVGVILLFVCSTLLATSLGLRIFAGVIGALITFVLLGHFLVHRKNRPRQ
jgi:hypothetical protein